MKIKTYQKKRGLYNISADIALLFPKRESLEGGYFVLTKLSHDAKNCFPKNMQESDINSLVKKMDEHVENFFKKHELEHAELKKIIYVAYESESSYFKSEEIGEDFSDLTLKYIVMNTYWNGNVLLKAVDLKGREYSIVSNSKPKWNENYRLHTLEYSPEKETFLKELISKLNQVEEKLNSFFLGDIREQSSHRLDNKIKELLSNKQKLIE